MALCNWCPLLAGSPHKVIIYSDHLNLQYWRPPQKISRRVAREVLELLEYNFKIQHIPGKMNGRANALSRRPEYDKGEEDNTNVVVLPDKVFTRGMQEERIPSLQQVISQEEMEPADLVYQQEWEVLKLSMDAHKLKKIDNVWYKDGRQVVTGGVQH